MSKTEPPRNQKVFARSATHERYRLPAPLAKPDEIWDRVGELLADEPESVPPEGKTKEGHRKRGAARRRARRLRWRRILDVVAVVVWSLATIKLLIGDLDRALLASLAPAAVWMLDLRWFLVLSVAALLLLLLNGRTLGGSLAYVIGYPLVLVCWKLPRKLIERRSPVLAVGLASLTFNLAARTRPFVYAVTLESLCGLIILVSDTAWVVSVAVVAFGIVLVWWLAVMAIDMFRTEALLRAQDKLIRWILGHKFLERFVGPEQPDQVTIKNWRLDDAKKYRDHAGLALIVRKTLIYWADSVAQYRRGPAVVILNAIVVVGMILQIILAFSFINYGIYAIDPAQFAARARPDVATFVYYSAAGIYFGEVSALSPLGTAAVVAKIANGVIGAIGVLTIVTSFLLNLRTSRADAGAASAINTLEEKADDLRRIIERQYRLTLGELETRLDATGWGGIGVLIWLASRTSSRSARATDVSRG